MKKTFAIGIGGAAGQGVATPGDIFAKIFSRRGLHLNAYNAYQSIIRGGHTFLTIRTGPEKVTNMGDRVDLLIPLNQDGMDRHLGLLTTVPHASTTLTQSSQVPPRTACSFARFPYPSWRTSLETKWPRTRSRSVLVSA
jgi:Pyruvate/2-oxoacid:ferredoxin oxidoreductase gamma subunit